jgi:hypothetical protein
MFPEIVVQGAMGVQRWYRGQAGTRGISGSKPIDGNPEAVPRNRVICNFSQWGVRGTGDALAASRAFVPSRHRL